MSTVLNCAWADSVAALVDTDVSFLMERLQGFVPDASGSQRRAWRHELEVLQEQGAKIIRFDRQARDDSAVLEYALPREAGRRPDVLILQSGRVVVMEFKESGELSRAALDQVRSYARDLAAYHEGCEGMEIIPLLVLCGRHSIHQMVDGVRVVPAGGLAATLVQLGRRTEGSSPDLVAFLNSEYAPLPSLVAAARLLFRNLRLPFIKRARSAGVHEAVDHVIGISRGARTDGTRHLVLVTGVPGAGKTLVGLQVAHHSALEEGYRNDRRRRGAPATFLSGNGPLVQVLQHALRSSAFVQDMHRYIREYGLEHPERVPPERLIVFDEAQRAWDRDKIEDFYAARLPRVPRARFESEPSLLVDIADRIDGWAVVLALVGDGQEIHTGEEAGIAQWREAIGGSDKDWTIHGPGSLAADFGSVAGRYVAEEVLGLDVTLRAQAATDLHRWVELVLDHGDLARAGELAHKLRWEGFPVYVTRDLDSAKGYVLGRFADEPERRYGILASSKAKNLEEFGLDPGFQATKRIAIGPWYNDPADSVHSCCRLDTVITEFQCQGLELDLPIVGWGSDFFWQGDRWQIASQRKSRLVHDPSRLRRNSYRVLLTRGREGMVILVPGNPAAAMAQTYHALIRAGCVDLQSLPASMAG